MIELPQILLGFIPLLDSAPLVVAAKKGFATAEGSVGCIVIPTSSSGV